MTSGGEISPAMTTIPSKDWLVGVARADLRRDLTTSLTPRLRTPAFAAEGTQLLALVFSFLSEWTPLVRSVTLACRRGHIFLTSPNHPDNLLLILLPCQRHRKWYQDSR